MGNLFTSPVFCSKCFCDTDGYLFLGTRFRDFLLCFYWRNFYIFSKVCWSYRWNLKDCPSSSLKLPISHSYIKRKFLNFYGWNHNYTLFPRSDFVLPTQSILTAKFSLRFFLSSSFTDSFKFSFMQQFYLLFWNLFSHMELRSTLDFALL